MITKKAIELLQSLKPFLSKDGLRLNMRQVFYDSKQHSLVSTDAHTLRFIECYLGEEDIFFSSEVIKELAKYKKDNPGFVLQDDSLCWGDISIKLDSQEHRFPDWKAVIPNKFYNSISFVTPDKKVMTSIVSICRATKQSLRIQKSNDNIIFIPSQHILDSGMYFEYTTEGEIMGDIDGVTFSAEFLHRCLDYDAVRQEMRNIASTWMVNSDTLIMQVMDNFDYNVEKLEKVS